MTVQEEMSRQWEQCRQDIDMFRDETNILLTWSYALLIVGLCAAAAGDNDFISVVAKLLLIIAMFLLACCIFMRQRSVRLSHIADAHQWEYPYDVLNSVETAPITQAIMLENGDFRDKSFSYPMGRVQLEAEINHLKERAESIFTQTALIFLIIISVSLPIIDGGNTEKIGRWCFLWLFAFAPTYFIPIPSFLIIYFELCFTGMLVMPFITAAELTLKTIMFIIAIAATAVYRIFAICMGCRANNLRLRLMSSPISTSGAEEL
ncbi:MAG: hypothetical protein ABL933_18335 [Methyloglobulus sp.]|nr:hypothetical protein [Methyloglobulus sp.]